MFIEVLVNAMHSVSPRYLGINYVEIPTVGISIRTHCIYQNLDNI